MVTLIPMESRGEAGRIGGESLVGKGSRAKLMGIVWPIVPSNHKARQCAAKP